MSEEILKALMQLFAIISKQGNNTDDEQHNLYIKEFLLSQISIEKFDNYYNQYEDYKAKQGTTSGGKTSVKDSVRTLAICKRINKTLSQKQKSVVLVRISEFIYVSENDSNLRLEIVETIGLVFKIDKQEFEKIILFSSANKLKDIEGNEDIQVYLDTENHSPNVNFINKSGLNNILFFCYLKSANLILFRFFGESQIQLNGLLIKPIKIHFLTDGATIRTNKNSVYFNEVLNNFKKDNKIEKILLDAHIPIHKFKGGKVALNNIQVVEEEGTLFGIMGGSGAGKTTMLNVLSGLEQSNEAIIKLNGHDIQSEESRANIGYIPQDDLLIEELTVYQNLYYNAKLINNTWKENEIKKRILKVLRELDLWETRDIKVGNALNKKISGGQRKRLNIALELIREPLVLFVDEPTSGLSSKDSENVIDLLKLLSQSGKIIFVVIHQPSSEIFKLFDKLMILDSGGLPIYYGNPIESVIYFKTITNQINQEIGECGSCGNVNPEQLFDTIESKEVDEFGKYTGTRKITAAKWNQFYHEKIKSVSVRSEVSYNPLHKINPPNIFKQMLVYFQRDLFSRINDRQYLLIALLEAPILAFVLSFIIRSSSIVNDKYVFGVNQNIPAYIFMLVIVALFVGLTISAEEIFKDQKILKREKFLRLSRFSYLMSKTSYLIGLSLLQSFILCLVGNIILAIPDNFIEYWIIIFSVFVFGNILGLILSSSFKTIVTIYIIIPIIIIPQMILGGAMFKYENLNKSIGGGYHVPIISRLMIANWGYESIMVSQFTSNTYQNNFYQYDQLLSEYSYRTSYLYPYMTDLLKESQSQGKLESDMCSDTIYNTLKFELTRSLVQELGVCKIKDSTIEEAYNLLAELEEIYQDKHNDVSRLKDHKVIEMGNTIGEQELILLKYNTYNEDVADIVQNSLNTTKYFIENSIIYQNYDHIYMRDHLYKTYRGNSDFMFLPNKLFLGFPLSTFWFNITMIWIFNIALFIILYFNLLKKVMSVIK